jgi:hypothetical protein
MVFGVKHRSFLLSVALLPIGYTSRAEAQTPAVTVVAPWSSPGEQPPPPPPLPPLVQGPPRRLHYSAGLIGGASIPVNGYLADQFDTGGTLLFFCTDEITRAFSARLEVGFRLSPIAAATGSRSAFVNNLGARLYLQNEGPVRPYLGAHLGYESGSIDDRRGFGSGRAYIALNVGLSVGANYHISDMFAIGAEVRGEGLFVLELDRNARGSFLSVLLSTSVFL